MKTGHFDEFKLVTGAMAILALATSVMVVVPYLLLDKVHPVGTALKPYSMAELRGRNEYVSQGCVYCHSQQPRDPAFNSADQERGWGRPSVASDYYYDRPHLLGTMRTGPDLMNIAVRQPSKDWHLGHLYQPRAYTPGSNMPAYPFLFEEIPATEVRKDHVVINLPPDFAVEGTAVVATPRALDLVAYLLAMDRTYPVIPGLEGDAMPKKKTVKE